MAKSDSNAKRPPVHSPAPESEPLNAPWDEDTVPRLDFEDAGFDRVTAIPELPPEVFAKQLMDAHAEAEDAPTSTVNGAPSSHDSSEPSGPVTTSIVPFELEAGVLPTQKPLFEPSEPAPASPAGLLSTAPPPGVRQPKLPELENASLELDLSNLGSEANPPVSDPALREIADRYATGDYSGALVLADGLLETQPEHTEAQRYAKNCREVLTQMYAARLGPLDHLVTMTIPSEQIRWLSLDHRAGFLLSLVDGTSSVEELLDISGMARLDALRILFSLVQERVIALTPRGG